MPDLLDPQPVPNADRDVVVTKVAPDDAGAFDPPHDAPVHKAVVHGLQVAGNQLSLYTESLPLIADMERDIRAARQRVWMESYIFLADAAGEAIAAALKDRAGAGCDVRLIYDAIGSASTPAAFFDDLAASGVKVHAFHPLSEALSRLAPLRVLNRRNHRKTLAIDDDVAYFGGMNVVDQTGLETIKEARARRLPASAGWRDVHVRLQGPRQHDVADAFARLWQRLGRDGKPRWPRWNARAVLGSQNEGIWFFDSQPGWRFRNPTRVFVPLIKAAQREITVSMAYFLPVGRVLRALYKARRRGVRVRVIVPEESDVRLVRYAARHLYGRLLKRGIEIHERQEQMLHSKVMIVDRRWSVVGSCNFDPRSLWLNLEFLGVFHSTDVAEALEEICTFEMSKSRRVTLDDVARRRWWTRLLDRGAYALRRLL
jgi:cardiolipin synthase A/B